MMAIKDSSGSRLILLDSLALRCPLSGLSLRRCGRRDAEAVIAAELTPLRKPGRTASGYPAPPPIGVTAEVLLREDNAVAYPIVDETPILLAPERLGPPADARPFDLADPRYAEAYDEMEFYNAEAADIPAGASFEDSWLGRIARSPPSTRTDFPDPPDFWLDAAYDCIAQHDAYRLMRPLRGGRFLQLGGKGGSAVTFLLAGAGEAWNVSPMLGEARYARAIGAAAGVGDRLHTAVAVAEELPFPNDSFDGVFAGGCLHHMTTEIAVPEIARILKPGGRFAAIEPWKTPFYDIGIRIFGKREANAYCRPLTPERIAPVSRCFPGAEIAQHGSITRYPLLVLFKFGVPLGVGAGFRIQSIDDTVSSGLGLRALGGSVAILATKGAP